MAIFTPYLPYIALGALALGFLSLIFSILIYVRVRKFFSIGKGNSFEGAVRTLSSDVSELGTFRGELETYIEKLEKRLTRSTQAIHSRRYNPFKGAGEGGLQSHSTALLSENGDGVMLSALSTRDRVSIFAKSIKNFACEDLELSPEEKEIIADAKKTISTI